MLQSTKLSVAIYDTFSSILPDHVMQYWNISNKYSKLCAKIGFSISAYLLIRALFIKLHRKIKGLPPGPIGLPYLGVMLYMTDRIHWGNIIVPSYGPVCTISYMAITTVVINDYKIAKNVFNKSSDNYQHYLSVGLSKPEKDHNAFGVTGIKRYPHLLGDRLNAKFVEKSIKDCLFQIIFPEIDKQKSLKLRPLCKPFLFNVMLAATTGFTLDSLKNEYWIDYENATKLIEKDLMKIIFSQIRYGRTLSPRYPNPMELQTKITAKYIKQNHDEMIKNKESFYSKMWEEYVETNKLTHDQLISDISGLLGAALDSVSLTIELCVLILCRYKQLQNKLYNELKDIFGIKVNNIKDIYSIMIKKKKLNLLRSFVYEVLRMYTPAPVAHIRVCDDKNIKIGYKNYIIPAGYTFQCNLYHINHDKKYWKNPDKFDLNNWLNEENGLFKRNEAFMSFSIGNRRCPGDMLAMKMLYVTLSLLIMKYELTANDHGVKWEISTKGQGLMYAHPQFPVTFTVRDES